MTLEDFKDVYKDKTPLEKLNLLIVQTDYIRDDVRSLERDRINGNEKGADYMRSEIKAMEERIQWLYDRLVPVLKMDEPTACRNTVLGIDGWGGDCPACASFLVQHRNPHYCGVCGQAVKWE